MAKANITQYSSTPSSNTDINNINIDENCPASGLNNAIRELMAHLKNVDTGSQALTALSVTGNLLVGTTNVSPANGNVVGIAIKSNGLIQASSDSNNQLTVNRKTNDGDMIIFKKDGTTVGNIGSTGGALMHIGFREDATNPVGLGGSGSDTGTVMPVTTSGSERDGAISLGKSSARFKNLYLSGGAYIGGTGSANYLDDVETGTWTPFLGGSTTYTSRSGVYRKVGGLVFIFGFIQINAIGTGNTQVISGLPFTSTEENTIPLSKLESSTFNFYSAQLRTSGTTLYLSAQTALDGTIDTNQNYFQNNTVIQFSGCYFV